MPLIYRERFDIGPESPQIMVGAHVFHQASYPPLRHRGILMCGVSEGRNFFEIERIDAPLHALVFCLSGHGEIFTPDGRTLPFSAGQLAFIPQGVHSGHRRTGDAPMHHVWLLLYHHQRWTHLNQDRPSVTHSDDGPALLDAVTQFHRETQRFNQGNAQNLVVPALDFLNLVIERTIQPLRPALGWAEQLQQLFAHVQQNLNQDWSNAALAEELHITTTHLHRLCAQHLGTSPSKVVFKMKMDQAKEHLIHGLSVSLAAKHAGYQEIASFSRRFRQHFGFNPSQARPRV